MAEHSSRLLATVAIVFALACASKKDERKHKTPQITQAQVEPKKVESPEDRLKFATGRLDGAWESFRSRDESEEDDTEFILLLAISDLQTLRRDLLETGFQPADPEAWQDSEKLQAKIVKANKRFEALSSLPRQDLSKEQQADFEAKYRSVSGDKQFAIRDFLISAGIDPEGRYAAELKVKITEAEQVHTQALAKLADASGAKQKKAARLAVKQAEADLKSAKRDLENLRDAEYE